MSALQFDFKQPTPLLQVLGYVLLLVGILVVILVFQQWQYFEQGLVQDHKKISSLTTQPRRQQRSDTNNLANAEIEKHRKEILRLTTLPWQRLLSEVEVALGSDIALLSVRPDPGKFQLTLEGEAKDYTAIVSFMQRLEASPVFSSVHLASHEAQTDVPGQPVHFTILMRWQTIAW